MTYFVVTKDYRSFREYCSATNRQIGVHCAFVDSPARLKGYTNPEGVLVGDWDQHPYITDILQSLLVQSTDPDKIRKIRRAREILAQRRGYVQVNQMVNK